MVHNLVETAAGVLSGIEWGDAGLGSPDHRGDPSAPAMGLSAPTATRGSPSRPQNRSAVGVCASTSGSAAAPYRTASFRDRVPFPTDRATRATPVGASPRRRLSEYGR